MFKIGSPVKGNDFIDRIKYLPKFKLLLESNQHIMIKAPRRFGKTSLVKHTFEHEQNFDYIYIDIRRATSLKSLANQILDKAYHFTGIDRFINKAKDSLINVLKSVQKIKIDDIAEITLEMIEKETDETEYFLHALDVVEKIAHKKNTNIKFVMDEFQDITKLTNKKILELLRSTIQHHENVTYIFLGSIESIMTDIFESKSSPFFHFTKVIDLGGLDTKEVFDYTKKALTNKKISYDEHSLKNLIDFLQGHPDYTAQTLQTLYINAVINGDMKAHEDDCINALCTTLLDNKAYLEELITKARMKKHQYEVLNAIANDKEVELTSKALYATKISLENLGLIKNISRGKYILTDILLQILLQQEIDEEISLKENIKFKLTQSK